MLEPMFGRTAELWLPLFTDLALKSTVVLAVTLTVWALMRRAPAASRHLTLLAGIAVLLGLPALMAFVPRQSLPSPTPIVQEAAPAPPTLAPMAFGPTVTLPPPSAPPILSPALPPSLPTTPPPAPVPWAFWLLAVWLAGVGVSIGRVLAAHLRVWRLIRSCPPLPENFRAALPDVSGAQRLGPAGTPPLVWGGVCPVLLLPAEALAWPADRLRAVLLHETAHLQRRDWLTQTLTQIACTLYWFNPLVWLAAHQMQAEAERACDDAVLLAGVPATDYAADLLAVARALTAARFASAGAVTMARRSPVRHRLEAILDTRRPRRSVTRRAAALSFLFALATAVPLASLRPAARADAPTAAAASESTSGVPTETEVTAVQQHLQGLEQEQAAYAAAHPNTLSSAQIFEVDQWIIQREAMRRQEQFDVNSARDTARLRVEIKKPHTKQERQQIWAQIFDFDQAKPVILKRQRGKSNLISQFGRIIAALPAEQRIREEKMYVFDSAVAADKTEIEAMEMERAEGSSFHLDKAEISSTARQGFEWEKRGMISCSDWVHTEFLQEKIYQVGYLSDADVDSLISILNKPLKAPSTSHAAVMVIFRSMNDPHLHPSKYRATLHPVPASQQEKIRAAVTPFLNNHSQWPQQDKWDHIFAKQVLKEYGGTTPTPKASPKTPPVPTPAAALIPVPGQ